MFAEVPGKSGQNSKSGILDANGPADREIIEKNMFLTNSHFDITTTKKVWFHVYGKEVDHNGFSNRINMIILTYA